MKTVDITLRAHKDIDGLREYLKEEFGVNTAKRIVGAVYDDLEKLAVFPQMGVDF